MIGGNLELLTAPDCGREAEEGWTQRQFIDAISDLKNMKGIQANRRVRLIIENPMAIPNPIRAYAALMLMGRQVEIISPDGMISRNVGAFDIIRAAVMGLQSRRLIERAIHDCDTFLSESPVRAEQFVPSDSCPFVLRANLWFGAKVGGAYTHASGVINAIKDVFGDVVLATTDMVPLLHPDIKIHKIDLEKIEGWDRGVGVHFAANKALLTDALRFCEGAPDFVYQRSGLGDLSGLRLARHRRRPMVLEYNGPEVWVAEKWGNGIAHADAFQRIETELLKRADLVLAVSKPLVDDAISRGASRDRVILSPNGVDCARFGPQVDGLAERKALGVGDRKTALLLSSFGPWHGVDVAIDAFAKMLNERNEYKRTGALVLAGDGVEHASARARAQEAGLIEGETVFFPGMIPADRAPSLLAACDVMLSPTKPNADGSPFFGSPTKIFEYMAAAKPIIASDLDQIGEILEHERTALLIEPGNAEDLYRKIVRVFENLNKHEQISVNARHEAVTHHSWTARMTAVKERLGELGLSSK